MNLTADHIVDLYKKHPQYKPGRFQPYRTDGENKYACASAIIAVDAGLKLEECERTFPTAGPAIGVADYEDLIGLALGFDGLDASEPGLRASIARSNKTRRELYLIGREAAEKLGLEVPPLEPILKFFEENPV